MSTVQSAVVIRRYKDAYRVGNAVITFGSAIKIVGLVLGILIVLFMMMTGVAAAGAKGALALFAGVIAGAPVALIFWLLGVIVAAQGQILLASLDEAVYASPFLDNDEKAESMTLPRSTQPTVVSSGSTAGSGATEGGEIKGESEIVKWLRSRLGAP